MKRPLWLAAAILFVAGIQTSSAYELTGRVVSVADGAHAPGFGSVFHFLRSSTSRCERASGA